MKKRKELNALIGLAGDHRRKKTKQGSGSHRLLRTEPPDSDSESSTDEEEFGAIGNRSRFVKGDYARCCKICCPLCAFVILAACVVASVGLVWMQMALKEDLDVLKEKFRTMESNQKSSFQEIPKLNEELLSKQKQLEKIESGELGLSRVWINITEMNKQISLLSSAVNHLKASVKSAADLLSLPSTVEGLQKENNGSNQILPSPSPPSELDNKSHSESAKQDILYLHNSLEEVNSTVVEYQRQNDLKLKGMSETLSNLTQRLSLIESHVVALSKAEQRTNVSSSTMENRAATLKRESLVTNRSDTVQAQSMKKEDNSNSQVSELREKLQLISALTNKPESNRPPETTDEEQVQNFTSDPSALPEFSQLLRNQIETQVKPLSLPGISSIKDLQDLFHKTGQDVDGMLTYQELWNSLGSAMPRPESLRAFDSNGDGRYSFLELRLALGCLKPKCGLMKQEIIFFLPNCSLKRSYGFSVQRIPHGAGVLGAGAFW
ncbi:EF-hand calcium-binding domain-containing protein 14 isoform X1 [Mus musculus]|uniref:EF-hand calcium-binding domain-containing protein 14 isoform X1 n=1 Tax=Mus musculus TaxID=10090 RepID=UPI00167213D8|nr:EF-hand calcium-binding domain-containing protein 14 isoform X1 [Mus musculus]